MSLFHEVTEAFAAERAAAEALAWAWDLPVIPTAGHLAEWLGVEVAELLWFADLKALGNKSGRQRLQHYRYIALRKRSGGVRLIESPKTRLEQMQRRILAGILNRLPAHPASQAFVRNRSIRTFVAPHVAKDVILRMDLTDFFPSISGPRAQALFRAIGYPKPVADLLGGLCTNGVPADAWPRVVPGVEAERLIEARRLYSRPHLPQGAPTSPSIANMAAYRFDCRLAALAQAAGAVYSRYADDLAVSGGREFARRAERFSHHVAAILLEEGFHVQHRKTRILRQGVRQQLTGLIVNQHPNIPRADFDRLKAILTNCIRHGVLTQNRAAHPDFRAHLEGRVGFVESINPERGRKLRSILERIAW